MELDLDWRRESSAQWPDVSYELRPLKVWAFQELLAYWEGDGAGPSGEAEGKATASASVRLMEVARRIFPEHVRGLSGLTIVQGGERKPAGVNTLCEETQTLPLAGEIISRLVAISEVGASAEKN